MVANIPTFASRVVDATRGPKGVIDDLPLFAAAAKAEPPEPKENAAMQALDDVDPDALSPRQALEALYRLKALRRDDDGGMDSDRVARTELQALTRSPTCTSISCYDPLMSKLLERAFKKAKTLPDDRQDQLGAMILDVVEQDQSSAHLTADQREEVRRRLADPQPAIASDDEVDAAYRSFAK